METNVQSTALHFNFKKASEKTKSIKLAYADFWQKAEFNRFGIIAMVLIVVTGLGGIAGAFAIQKSALLLALVALPTMATEVFILAVLPMRIITITALISAIISLAVIIIFY